MKYVVIVGDGMADSPIRQLNDKTPLQVAATPHMDFLASVGILGRVRTIPHGMHPGSDVANLSILGYDPREFYSGRAPLEAASIGVGLERDDVAFRCNLVTLKFHRDKAGAVMEDYSSGHITSSEARELMHAVQEKLGSETIRFHSGVSYRHLMVWSHGSVNVECVPPHDILGKDITDYLPVGEGEYMLRQLMKDSVDILENHPVNRNRQRQGKNSGNSIWLWGQGKKPELPSFQDKYALEGALVSAVDLTKGLGIYAGFEILNVPGITGYLDTNYKGKAEAALEALKRVDFVYIHVEAPDEAGHSGNCSEKIKAIEDFDSLVVGSIIEGMKTFHDYRIMILPDHPTPVELRTHTDLPVPFVIFDNGKVRDNAGAAFSEDILARDDLVIFEEGYRLMDFFMQAN